MTQDEIQAVALKPCPFCGNDGSGPIEHALHVSHTQNDWHSAYDCYSVQCDKCTVSMGYSDNEAEAIAAWNTRADTAPTPKADEVEAVKAAIANTTDSDGDRMDAWYQDGELRALALSAIAALDAARGDPVARVVEWQPIETAPTDGTWVQLWGPDGYRGCGRCWRNIDFDDATHWQPIPTGPDRGDPFNVKDICHD